MDIYNFIQEIYTEVPYSIQFTLKRLIVVPNFLESIKVLREEGWKDWQILGGIKSITLAYRFQFGYENVKNTFKARKKLKTKSKQPEQGGDLVVPLSEYSLTKLRNVIKGGKELLLKHYVFEDEDVEHKDLFMRYK